jgi:hypothetical protein
MFVNWTTQSYFILKCNPVRVSRLPTRYIANNIHAQKSVSLLAIIPQHIVLKDPSIDVEVEVEEGQDKIHLISTDALAHWAPTFGIDAYGEFCLVSLDDMPRRSTFVSTDRWRSLGSFSVVESPLQDGTYRVWINGDMDNEGQGHLVGYRLSIPVGGVPQWRRRETKSEPGWRESLNCAVPYSGHMLSHSHSVHKIIPPTASFCSDHAEVQFPHAGDYIDVAQYAGALTYSTSSSVVIQYYK